MLLTLVCFLLFQTQPTGSNVQAAREPAGFRVNGKVTVGQNEPAAVEIRLKNELGEILATARSAENGTFSLDLPKPGSYTVNVTDSRFIILNQPFLIRETADAARLLAIVLQPNKSDSATDFLGLDMTEIARRVPPRAMDEFLAGLKAKKNRDSFFRKAIQIEPAFYEAYLQLGLEMDARKLPAEAVQAFKRAAELRPADPRPLGALARAYVENNQFQDGADILLRKESLGSLNAADRYFLGVAFYRLGNLQASRQQLEGAIALAPGTNPNAYLQLHDTLMKLPAPEAGLAALEQFIRLFPADARHANAVDRAKKLRTALNRPH